LPLVLVKIHPDTANRIGQLIILIILTEVTAMVFQYLREMVLTKLIQWPKVPTWVEQAESFNVTLSGIGK